MCDNSEETEEDIMSTAETLMSLAAAVQRQTVPSVTLKSSGTHLVGRLFFSSLVQNGIRATSVED